MTAPFEALQPIKSEALDGLAALELSSAWDLLATALIFWGLIVWLRRSQAQAVLFGMCVMGASYLAVRALGLSLTSQVLGAAAVACLAACIVMLHREIRSGFEWALHWRRPPGADAQSRSTLAEVITNMAANRVGALLVFPGRRPIESHIHGAVPLDACLSAPLLLSLFDASSPGHDGALVVSGTRLVCFAAHLPLSTNTLELEGHGTRHASALGLSEHTDASCLVVSEEHGTISLARDGTLRELRPDEVLGTLGEISSVRRPSPRKVLPRARVAEVFGACALTLFSWWVIIPGSQRTTTSVVVGVQFENLPEGYQITAATPEKVELTLSVPRRELLLRLAEDATVVLDVWSLRLGRRVFTISAQDVTVPEGAEILAISPRRVNIEVETPDGPSR